jgi:hypothetical protein
MRDKRSSASATSTAAFALVSSSGRWSFVAGQGVFADAVASRYVAVTLPLDEGHVDGVSLVVAADGAHPRHQPVLPASSWG